MSALSLCRVLWRDNFSNHELSKPHKEKQVPSHYLSISCFSLTTTDTESEANPNNNLMIRQWSSKAKKEFPGFKLTPAVLQPCPKGFPPSLAPRGSYKQLQGPVIIGFSIENIFLWIVVPLSRMVVSTTSCVSCFMANNSYESFPSGKNTHSFL